MDDIDDTVARLEALGGELVGRIEQFENVYRLCFVRGPGGIIVGIAQQIGSPQLLGPFPPFVRGGRSL